MVTREDVSKADIVISEEIPLAGSKTVVGEVDTPACGPRAENYSEFRIDPVDLFCSNDLTGLICEDDMYNPSDSSNQGGNCVKLFGAVDVNEKCVSVARTTSQVGGVHLDIVVDDSKYWEKLPTYVCVDVEKSTVEKYSRMYNVDVPIAVVGIGPNCVAPVFQKCVEGVCSCVYVLSGMQCQLKPCRFTAAILGFGDDVTNEDAYVLTCAYRGARIVDHNCPCDYECANYTSITGKKFSQEMDEKIQVELLEGKVRTVKSRPTCVHSLGGIAKSNGKLRPITDCSQPEGRSINEYMSTTCEKFRYKTIDTVVGMLHPMDYGAVTDIESAYRTIHVSPAHRTFQGFKWVINGEEEYLEDLRLCFGLRSAPFIFTQFSDFIVKCCDKLGASRCVNYLDDFAVLGHTEMECSVAQELLHNVLWNFGFKVAENKVVKPSQSFKYLGIRVDSIKMTVSIDDDKLSRVRVEVLGMLDKSSCKRKALEEVSGLLAHCATVVKGGRTFARRIYNALRDSKGDVIHLDETIRQDFIWWASFIHWFNGRAKVLGAAQQENFVYTDSSNYGFGAHISDDYFWGVWGEEAADCPHSVDPPIYDSYSDHINITELWPVVVAIHRWGVMWRDSTIWIVTDNTQVQSWVNSGRSISPYAMAWLRELFWVAAFYNLNIKAGRISSEDNIWADALSRLNNPDCVYICEHDIVGFSECCRVAGAARGMV